MTLLKWEIIKIIRRRATYVSLGLIAAFAICIIIGFQLSDFRTLRRFAESLPIDPLQYVNGYYYANFCLNIAFFSLLPLLSTIIAGSQLAGEAADGTLRLLMVRPVSRLRVFSTKALVSFLWIQVQVFFLLVVALAIGLVVLGGGDLLIFVWEFRAQGPWVVDGSSAAIFLSCTALAGLSLFMISSAALAISAFTRNAVIAHIGTLGAFFISSVIHSLPSQVMSPAFKRLMPTSHMTFWHELYQLWNPDPNFFDAGRFWSDLAWIAGYTALFLAIGAIGFARRDITS